MVAGYRESGLTRKAYCRELGIAVTTLDYYLRRQGERARKQAGLMPVELATASAAGPLTLVLGGGLRLEVGAGFDEATLRRLLTVLS